MVSPVHWYPRVGLVNRSEATVKIGFVDTVNRLTALVISLETNTV